ncbi:intracellular septation protein [Novosphingobium kunmingense]|uniref:Inner membrane-spanning protein YciB n=1 Tax=Novosphingobium kunmingense TaxID=1211806 RepID=A0A2N0I358_9SPHN|nr:inner membrane-spanning protein YciB [Novosphingobium kunmingense]PKB25628.1 intracellular septation protein [Novosphingobium kunmingense]
MDEPAATPAEGPTAKAKPRSGLLNLLVDYGPIVVFFVVYRLYAPADHSSLAEVATVIRATASFMAAAVLALTVSKWKLGHVSPMLWLSTAMIVVFGGLTIAFQNAAFIQLKPTLIYLLCGLALLIGAWRGKALLKILLDAAFEGLNDEGWLKLSRRWGWFFLFLAALNEVLRYLYNQENGGLETWIGMKLWVFLPLTFLFTFTQLPMLLKHGLAQDAQGEVVTDPLHD